MSDRVTAKESHEYHRIELYQARWRYQMQCERVRLSRKQNPNDYIR